jgi:hypothetical protein
MHENSSHYHNKDCVPMLQPRQKRRSILSQVTVAARRRLRHLLERKSIHEAVFANSAARGRSVRARVDLAGVNVEREGSGRRKIHLNDNRRTTALLARNW